MTWLDLAVVSQSVILDNSRESNPTDPFLLVVALCRPSRLGSSARL